MLPYNIIVGVLAVLVSQGNVAAAIQCDCGNDHHNYLYGRRAEYDSDARGGIHAVEARDVRAEARDLYYEYLSSRDLDLAERDSYSYMMERAPVSHIFPPFPISMNDSAWLALIAFCIGGGFKAWKKLPAVSCTTSR